MKELYRLQQELTEPDEDARAQLESLLHAVQAFIDVFMDVATRDEPDDLTNDIFMTRFFDMAELAGCEVDELRNELMGDEEDDDDY